MRTTGWTELNSYECSQCNDNTASLGKELFRLKSNGHAGGFRWWNHWLHEPLNWRASAVVWLGEGWALTGLPVQDTLYSNEYFSDFRPRYVEKTGQMLGCTITLKPHPVKELKILMMTICKFRVFSSCWAVSLNQACLSDIGLAKHPRTCNTCGRFSQLFVWEVKS